MSTFVNVAVMGGLTVVSSFFFAWLVRLGARWGKIPNVGFGRALATVVILQVMGILLLIVPRILSGGFPNRHLGRQVFILLLGVILSWLIIQRMFRTSSLQAIKVWLLLLLGNVLCVAIIKVAVIPFVMEAFYLPANSMAPTLVGEHYVTACPLCGGRGIVSAGDRADGQLPEEELGICQQCLQASTMRIVAGQAQGGDSVVASKYLRPQRWDIVVFRWPEEPSINHVQRLVGLPGEEVAIQDGELLINGQVMPKPPEIAGLEYVNDPQGDAPSRQYPSWKLGPDEYFVLGDFSQRALDSRLWSQGAPGHPTYAVPGSYIEGVVTHIYWPPSRWSILR